MLDTSRILPFGSLVIPLVGLVFGENCVPCLLFFGKVESGKWAMGFLLAYGMITGSTKPFISSIFHSIQFSPSDRVIDIIQENFRNVLSSLPGDLMDFLLLSTSDIVIPDIPFIDTLSWMDSSSEILFLKDAWNLLRTCTPVLL